MYYCKQIEVRENLIRHILMACTTVFGLHANYVDKSKMPFPNNTNYSHLGKKENHTFNSPISLIGIFTTSV